MPTLTLAEVEKITGVSVFDYLTRDAEVPTVTKSAAQGDVSILRVAKRKAATTPIPKAGIAVVKGENGSNTHSLHGDAFFNPSDGGGNDLLLGTLTVPKDSEAYLLHPEHGGMAIQTGTYEIGRQREFAGEWRMVAD